jgi:hypothetical protein
LVAHTDPDHDHDLALDLDLGESAAAAIEGVMATTSTERSSSSRRS